MLESIFKRPNIQKNEKVEELVLNKNPDSVINEVRNDLNKIKNSLQEKRNSLESLKKDLEEKIKNTKIGEELDHKGDLDQWLKKEEYYAGEEKKDIYNEAKLRNQREINEINSTNPEAKDHLDKLIEINKMLVEIDNIERSFFEF